MSQLRAFTPRLAALLVTTMLSTAAMAQSATPLRRNWDSNGIDLVRGDFQLNFTEATIGSGRAMLSLNRVNGSYAPLDWDRVRLRTSTTGGVTTTTITLPDGSNEVFDGATNVKANGATLATNTSNEKVLTLHDGETMTFQATASSDGYYIKEYKDIGVTTLTFAYQTDSSSPVKWRLSSISNDSGYSIVFNYQSSTQGNAGWIKRASAQLKRDTTVVSTVGYAYPSAGVTDLTDPTNNVWRITDTSIKRPNESTAGFSITQSGGIATQVVRDGVTTSYGRTVSGNVVTLTMTDALNGQTVVTSDLSIDQIKSVTDPLGRTTSFLHDSNGRLYRTTEPEGNYVEYQLDSSGNATLTIRSPKPGSNEVVETISKTFSTQNDCIFTKFCNRVTSVTDGNNNTTEYAYHFYENKLKSITYPAVNGVQAKTTYSYTNGDLTGISECQNANLGNCLGTADEVVTTLGYDTYHNLTSVTKADGVGAVSTTSSMTYDAAGNLKTVDGPLGASAADITAYRYDASRRLVGVITPDPDGTTTTLKMRATRNNYDTAGQLNSSDVGTVNSQSDADWAAFSTLQTVTFTRDTNQRVVKQALSAGATTYAVSQVSYDALGRPECQAVRNNSAIFGSLPASACTLGATGSAGPDQIARTYYDAAGQTTKVLTSYGTTDVKTKVALTFSDNGNALTLKDAENNLTKYLYDGHDRLSRTFYPTKTPKGAGTSSSTDYEELGYDKNDNIVSRRLRDGSQIAFQYDPRNRLKLKDLPGTEPDVTYGYDNLGRMTSASQTGHSLTFTYDALSRNLTQVGPQGTLTSEWDAAGRRTKLTYPGSNLYLNFDYYVTGESRLIRENGATTGIGVLATFKMDLLGNRTKIIFGNGATQDYGFDAVSRLTSLTNNLISTPDDQTIGMSYSPAGQIISQTRSNDGYAWTGAVAVSHNDTANGLNQYTQTGAVTPTYDNRGNLTYAGSLTYDYTSENMLKSAAATGVATTTLTYDPAMRLYQVVKGSSTTRFQYDGLNMIAEYDGSNAVQRRYVFGQGIDEPLVQYEGSGTSTRRFLHADERGTIIAVSDDTGARFATNTYDEYGIPGTSNYGRFQYTGQMWLPELGMYHYKARMYLPNLGRFQQVDPISVVGGINLYAYVLNDPINYVDPLGLTNWGKVINRALKTGFTNSVGGAVAGAVIGGVIGAPAAGVGAVPGAIVGAADGAFVGFVEGLAQGAAESWYEQNVPEVLPKDDEEKKAKEKDDDEG